MIPCDWMFWWWLLTFIALVVVGAMAGRYADRAHEAERDARRYHALVDRFTRIGMTFHWDGDRLSHVYSCWPGGVR